MTPGMTALFGIRDRDALGARVVRRYAGDAGPSWLDPVIFWAFCGVVGIVGGLLAVAFR